MTGNPVICFGQQPCGFFPKRFLYAKIITARRLQSEIGGEIVFFFHDSDHDPRETLTIVKERHTGHDVRLNFQFANKIQRQFSPLYVKQIVPDWHSKMTRQMPAYVNELLAQKFARVSAANPADFCLQMYQEMGLLNRIRVERSSDPAFRKRAAAVADYFVDVLWDGEIVRARFVNGQLLLHKGGDNFIEVPAQKFGPAQISPTRDTRLAWMQSVIQCTHYVAGAGERRYLNEAEAPGVIFVPRVHISEADNAYTGD